jgi:WD40 repeat protein
LADLRFLTEAGQIFPLLAHDRVEPCYDASFSDDGQLLATAGGDGMIFVWRIDNQPGGYSHMKVHDAAVRSVAISADKTYIASASDDKTVKVWSPWNVANNWQLYKQLTDHEDKVTCIAFDKSGHWIASGSDDKTIRLWNFETNETHVFRGHEAAVTQVVFLPQGGLLASSSRDHTIRLWKLPDQKPKD